MSQRLSLSVSFRIGKYVVMCQFELFGALLKFNGMKPRFLNLLAEMIFMFGGLIYTWQDECKG